MIILVKLMLDKVLIITRDHINTIYCFRKCVHQWFYLCIKITEICLIKCNDLDIIIEIRKELKIFEVNCRWSYRNIRKILRHENQHVNNQRTIGCFITSHSTRRKTISTQNSKFARHVIESCNDEFKKKKKYCLHKDIEW